VKLRYASVLVAAAIIFGTSAPVEAIPISTPPLTISSAAHSAFPGASRTQDGRLLVVWRQGTSHLSFDGDIWGSYSSDDGATWTTPAAMVSSSVYDLRDPSLALINGVLYMTFCTSQSPDKYGNGVYVSRSTDSGAHWTPKTRIDASFPRAGESGPVSKLVNGNYIQPFYGHPTGETRDSLYIAYSSDGIT